MAPALKAEVRLKSAASLGVLVWRFIAAVVERRSYQPAAARGGSDERARRGRSVLFVQSPVGSGDWRERR
jgi:hypothetical protein